VYPRKLAKKLFVLITGMYRSGTSIVARALNLAGVYLGNLEDLNCHLNYNNMYFQVDDDGYSSSSESGNPRGSWEHKKLLELAEKTLALNYVTWDQDFSSKSSNLRIQEQQKVFVNEEIGRQIRNYTQGLIGHPSLAAGINDPQIVLYLEAWLQYLPENFVIVGVFRHPIRVAESLKRTNQFGYNKSLSLWKIYNDNLISLLEKYGGFLLNLDWPKDRLSAEMQLIAKKLGLVHENITDVLDDLYSEEEEEDLICHNDVTIHINNTNNDIGTTIKALQSQDNGEGYPQPLDDGEIISLYSQLQKRAEDNNVKCRIKEQQHHSRTQEELWEITQALLSDMKKQGKYFRKLSEEFELLQWRLRFEILERQKIVEEHGNEFKLLREKEDEIKKLVNDVEILQNINLEHQEARRKMDAKINGKTIEEKDNQISQLNDSITIIDTQLKESVKDVETLQNINLGHQKTIEEKDAELKEAIKELQRIRCEIDAIHNSISWRTLTPIKKCYERIFQVNKK
jgi:hypothetical protein